LDFGYVDHPPMIPFLAAFIPAIFGNSTLAFRLLPMTAGAVIVFMAGIITKELGGKTFAQITAALSIIISRSFITLGGLLTTNVFDQLFWALILYILILIIKKKNYRLWLYIGLIAGLGLMTKHTMAFLLFGIIIGIIFTDYRKMLYSKYPWYGALIAFVIFLPNLIWEMNHNWATIEFLQKASINRMAGINPLEYLRQQLYVLNPILLPLWIAGLYYFLFYKKAKAYRMFGWIYILLLIIFILMRGKSYYLIPYYLLIFAGGAVFIEILISKSNYKWLKPSIIVLLIIAGITIMPLALPILPIDKCADYVHFWGMTEQYDENGNPITLPPEFSDMIGWEAMVKNVAKVYNSLPPKEKEKCAVMANNYGQASAIDFYGAKYGLPKAISGHNNYWYWGPRDYSGDIMITVGIRLRSLRKAFNNVEQKGTIKNKYAIWYENNQPIYLWKGIKLPLRKLWPQMKLFY